MAGAEDSPDEAVQQGGCSNRGWFCATTSPEGADMFISPMPPAIPAAIMAQHGAQWAAGTIGPGQGIAASRGVAERATATRAATSLERIRIAVSIFAQFGGCEGDLHHLWKGLMPGETSRSSGRMRPPPQDGLKLLVVPQPESLYVGVRSKR